MPRKPSKKTLTKKLDKLWSKLVLSRGKCEVCGKSEALNAHHYISRSNRRLRWDLHNGICVCAGCHVFKNDSFHKNPVWGHFWMEEHRWEDLQYITCHMNEIKKWTEEEVQEQIEKFENKLTG